MRWSICQIAVIAVIACPAVPSLAAGREGANKPPPFSQGIERPIRTWDYDGKQILGHVGEEIRLWDATTGKLLRKLQGHKERLFTLRFSPDGVHALSSSWMAPGPMVDYKSKDTRTIVWNLANGDDVAHFPDQVAGEFSADGKRIVTFSKRPDGSTSFDAVVSDVSSGLGITKVTLDDYSGPDWDALHFTPDGRRFAHVEHGAFLLYNHGSVVLFDAGDGRQVGKKVTARSDGGGHRFTAAGALASWGRAKATVTDAESGRVVRSAAHDLGMVDSVWAHDGGRVVALRGGKELKVLDLATGKMTTGDALGPYLFGRAVVSPDDRHLLVEWGGANDVEPGIGLYDMGTGKEIARVKVPERGHIIGFAPDSKTLLVGGPEFVIYDAENGTRLRGHKLLDDAGLERGWNR